MGFFLFLVGLFIFLLVYTMVSSVIKVSLYLTTKHSYSNIRLFIPTILTLLVTIILAILLLFSIQHFTNKNLYEILFEHILRLNGISSYFKILLPLGFAYIVFLVLLQSLTYFCVNINLSKIWNTIRFNIKKLFKIIPNENNEILNIDEKPVTSESIETKVTESEYNKTILNNNSQIVIENEKEKLSFTSALVASLFTFCFILFSVIILLIIGFMLSDKIPL